MKPKLRPATLIRHAKEKMDSFSARGSNCPICKKEFRTGCNHSVAEAEQRLFENYIKAITNAQRK